MPRVGRWTPVAGRNAEAPTAGRNARDTHTPEPTCMPRVRSYEPVALRCTPTCMPRVKSWEPTAGHRWPAPTAGRNAHFAHSPEPTCMPRVSGREPVSRRVITPLRPRVTRWEPQAARRRDG
jgi:hypothetical protein